MRPLIRLLERLDAWRQSKILTHAEHVEKAKLQIDAAQKEWEAAERDKLNALRDKFNNEASEAMLRINADGEKLKALLDTFVSIDQEHLAAIEGKAPERIRLALEVAQHMLEAAGKDDRVAQVLVNQMLQAVGQTMTKLIQDGGPKRIITPHGSGKLLVPR